METPLPSCSSVSGMVIASGASAAAAVSSALPAAVRLAVLRATVRGVAFFTDAPSPVRVCLSPTLSVDFDSAERALLPVVLGDDVLGVLVFLVFSVIATLAIAISRQRLDIQNSRRAAEG